MITPTANRTSDLVQLTAAAERARTLAAEASASASAAQAEAQLAAERIHAERDVRFVRWAVNRVAESGATEKDLATGVDVARLAFEASVSDGTPDFVSKYLTWSESAARLYHHRGHVMTLRGQLHHRRRDEYAAPDTARSTTDSRSSIPPFSDALARAVAMAAAARSGDVEDALQAELQAALRGDFPAAPDRRGG